MANHPDALVAERAGPTFLSRLTRAALWLAGGHLEAGDLARAESAYRAILEREPECSEAWFFLGLVSQRRRQFDAAAGHYEHALRLDPTLAEAHNNLGVIVQSRGEAASAEASFRAAIRHMEDYAEAHNNLGNALQDQGRFEEAVASYRKALRIQPRYVDAIKNMGNALRVLDRLDEAMACYDDGLRIAPNHVLLHMARAMVWIQRGDYERGWAECEWRLRAEDSPVRHLAVPQWDGAPLDGRKILLYAEQGSGDTIQFIRHASLVAQRGGEVVVACPPHLRRILASCPGVTEVVVPGGPLPEFSCHCPVISLPHVCGTTLDTIPAEIPYLFPDLALVASWRHELERFNGLRVGIVWQGNPLHTRDRERSFRLAQLEPIARIAGVRLFSLQKNLGIEQLAEISGQFEVIDLGSRVTDFMETAAVMRNLDLVITPDSSPAHLAGALGIPVWTALPYVADWRWMSHREDTPWYPSMRLFRQHRFGDWSGVIARMAEQLPSFRESRR